MNEIKIIKELPFVINLGAMWHIIRVHRYYSMFTLLGRDTYSKGFSVTLSDSNFDPNFIGRIIHEQF